MFFLDLSLTNNLEEDTSCCWNLCNFNSSGNKRQCSKWCSLVNNSENLQFLKVLRKEHETLDYIFNRKLPTLSL